MSPITMKKTNDSKLDIGIAINNNTNIVDNLQQQVNDFIIIIDDRINSISGEIHSNIPTNFDKEKFKYSISNEDVNFTVN